MKFLQYVTILACFIANTAHANHFVDPADPRADNMYDAFNEAFIDPERWRGQEFGSPLSATEAVREISRGKLRLFHRIHGEIDNDTGVRVGGTRLHFTEPETIERIQLLVHVTDFEALDCPFNPSPARARATLQGFFFNTGIPTPGSHTNDVTAQIQILRSSDSSNPPDVLDVRAQIFQCLNSSCSSVITYLSSPMGTVRVGQIMSLRLTWDPVNDDIRFERDHEPTFGFIYTGVLSDGAPAGRASKFFDITNVAPNCMAGDRPEALMEVFFDNIRIN